MITRLKILLEKLYMVADAIDRYKKFPNIPYCVEDKNSTRNILRIDLINYLCSIVVYDKKITERECKVFEEFLGIPIGPDEIIDIYERHVKNKYVLNNSFDADIPESLNRFLEHDVLRGFTKYGISGIYVSLIRAIGQITDWIDKSHNCSNLYFYCSLLEKHVKKRIPEIIIPEFIQSEWSLFTIEEYDQWKHGFVLDIDTLDIENKNMKNLENLDDDEFTAIKNIAQKKNKKKSRKRKTLQELLDELNGLIGLDNIKEDVRSLINMINVMELREKRGMKKIPMSLHLVFSGNPGTGKTTVARLLAKIYNKMGLLSKGHLIEVDRSGLVAGYVGQTAIKTKEVIDSAIGGVLFIDEAYSLTTSDSGDDYGQEAIDTILKAMEDNRDNFVVIVAGYPDLMVKFVESNPGLKSRFNKFMYFIDYSPAELTLIFQKLCEDNGYVPHQEVIEYVLCSYEEFYDVREANFANGRSVRNVFEKVVTNQANRIAVLNNVSDDDLVAIIMDDIEGIRF